MLKERKNPRLKYYDYNTEGAYFITFCTHNMAQILAVCVGAIHESPVLSTISKNMQYENTIYVGAIHESPVLSTISKNMQYENTIDVGAIHESPILSTKSKNMQYENTIDVGAIHESPALSAKSNVQYDNTVCVGAIHESPEITLTDMGEIVKDVIENLSAPHINIPYYTIMPNHVHLIIEINDCIDKNKRSMIAKIIGKIKMNASKQIRKLYGDIKVWQRGFHDHIVRNEEDYKNIAEYIQNNPLKWELDCFYEK